MGEVKLDELGCFAAEMCQNILPMSSQIAADTILPSRSQVSRDLRPETGKLTTDPNRERLQSEWLSPVGRLEEGFVGSRWVPDENQGPLRDQEKGPQ